MRPAQPSTKDQSVRSPFLLQFMLLFWLSVSPAGAQTLTTIHQFTNGIDGAYPYVGLISDAQGNFFGAAFNYQGVQAFGTVFELSPTSGGTWNLTTVYAFQGGLDGNGPNANLVMDKAGNLYGATYTGGNGTSSYCDNGTGQHGCGTIFEISPDGHGGWQKTTLYQFQGIVGTKVNDGWFPSGPLTVDSAGNLYGTTVYGGAHAVGGGTAFELSPTATEWKETILVNFGGVYAAGVAPEGGVIFDSAGNLYGTTINGGSNNQYCEPHGCGTVFKLSPKSGGGWSVTPLHTFLGTNGAYPATPLVFDSSGNLYGVARGGGKGSGVVFKLEPGAAEPGTRESGSVGWKETIVLQFYGANGALPEQLIADHSGNLYGATVYGGKMCRLTVNACGEVFKLSPSTTGSWLQTILYRFSGAADGANPNAPLILDALGNLYGVATNGGTFGVGTAFEITP